MKSTIQPIKKEEIPNLHISYSFNNSLFSRICIASTDQGICSVNLVTNSDLIAIEQLKNKFKGASMEETSMPEHQDFLTLFEHTPINLNYHLLGTAFQLEVWQALLTIPKGETTTYGAIAATIGKPKAYRAVGSAVGDNPIFYAIPCHRVVPATGGIGHYFWGTEIKNKILTWEKAI